MTPSVKDKNTDLLIAELIMIARVTEDKGNAAILLQAAERLHELDVIAEFFRTEAEKLLPKPKKVTV